MEVSIETKNKRGILYIFTIAIVARLIAFHFFPIDWNWDSYHHWQISLLSLRIGFSQGRLWDLNGCEYYWGIFPHLVQSMILGILKTSSMQPYRLFNVLFGAVNSILVYLIGNKRSSVIGFRSGLLYALFPFAIMFDVLGLQDTIALTFLLTSLFLFEGHQFWSGISLAVAAQSRNEMLLISIVIITWILIIERLSTDRMPFLIGWLLVTIASSLFVYSKTGNPFYGLYWNLFSVFTSGDPSNSTGFLNSMINWGMWKLSIWPSKPTGIVILSAVLFAMAYFIKTLGKRPRYYDMVFLLSTAALTAPIYLTYLGSDNRMFFIMARIMNPVVALSLPIFMAPLLPIFHEHKIVAAFSGIPVLFMGLTLVLAPMYLGFQEESRGSIEIADGVGEIYGGGTIICDYPIINYYLIDDWHIDPTNIIGTHYSPHYYGSNITHDYLKWLWNKKVTLFVRYGDTSEIVYYRISSQSDSVLMKEFELYEIECYSINKSEILKALN